MSGGIVGSGGADVCGGRAVVLSLFPPPHDVKIAAMSTVVAQARSRESLIDVFKKGLLGKARISAEVLIRVLQNRVEFTEESHLFG